MKEQIKLIVESGGSVSFPYKTKMSEWVETADIGKVNDENLVDPYYISIHGQYFKTLEEALDVYMRKVFTKKNLGLGIQGIYRHKLNNKYLDDMKEAEVKALILKYFDEYYLIDFPWLKK